MKKTLLTIITALMAGIAYAQGIDGVLDCIERNNPELQALRKEHEAGCLDIKAQNNLDDPSVEYSPFFNKETSGVASSELVVSQGFDFPTVYAARSKAANLQQEALRQQLMTSRRDIMFSATTLCLDLVCQQRRKELVDTREGNAISLQRLCEKRLKEGDATILELNKIKMDLMAIKAEKAKTEAVLATTVLALTSLNGGKPLPLSGIEYPELPTEDDATLLTTAIAGNRDINEAIAAAKASEQDVKLNRQAWLPKIDIGYRRNTDGSDASNGFLVGATFPIFSSKGKLKAAKARQESDRLKLENARATAESTLKAKIGELKQLRRIAEAYDTTLMHQTLELLMKAVEQGEMTITDYYTQADGVYQSLLAQIDIERQLQGVVADIRKDEL